MWIYLALATLSITTTALVLFVTKTPALVMLIAASVASAAIVIAARLDLGYWDAYWPIALTVSWGFAAIVSLTFLGLGRWRKWHHFVVRVAEK